MGYGSDGYTYTGGDVEGDMSLEAINHPSWSKRVVVDFAAPVMSAMRDWKIMFGAIVPKKEEYVVRVWKSGSPPLREDKLDLVCLSNTFWEQSISPGDYMILYPVSCLKRTVTVKSALSNALISGWFLKSAIPNTGTGTMSLRKTQLRQSSKKPYFFVLRNSTCFCFKSDSKTEKLHKVILLDYYRISKETLPDGKGFALRLELWETGFSAMNPMYVLHTQAEADVDSWYRVVLMVQKPALPVFGISLTRVVNRIKNAQQYCPDFLAHLLDELKRRFEGNRERWRCLLAGDAKPPAELKEVDSTERLPNLSGYADTACAATLRAYLLALPEPLIKGELFLLLDTARTENNLPIAASAWHNLSDIARHSLELVLQLLLQVPAGKQSEVCQVYGPAVAGTAFSARETSDVLLWVLEHFAAIVSKANATVDISRLKEIAKEKAKARGQTAEGVASSAPPTPSSPASGSSAEPQVTTVSFKFEARSPKELSVEAGDTVRILQTTSATGWALVLRLSDEAQGLVPLNYLARNTGDVVSPRVGPRRGSEGGRLSSPSISSRAGFASPRAEEPPVDRAAEERLCRRYAEFEKTAIDALMEERRAKERMLAMIVQLEQQRRQ